MAHREWNPKTFFKRLSPEVMAEYETARGLALERPTDRPPHDQTYYGWMALPETARLRLERELLEVNDLSSAHARPYLDQLAVHVWGGGLHANLVAEARDWTTSDLAMRLFLADKTLFAHCHRDYAIDAMDHFHEYQGRYPAALHVSPESKAQIKTAMAIHFRQHLGDAKCGVEDHEGKDKLVLFIIHEDERTPIERFDDAENLIPDWQRPVVRIACVYYPETLTLLVKAPKKRERERLRDLFAYILVGDKNYFEDTNKQDKFSFDPLRDPSFGFPTRPADRIDTVSVVQVTAESPHVDAGRIVIGVARGRTMVAVHDVLTHHGIDPVAGEILGVRLQFMFQGSGNSRRRTVSLTNPNGTNLRDTPRDRIIRRYLKEWKIDALSSRFALAAPAVGAP